MFGWWLSGKVDLEVGGEKKRRAQQRVEGRKREEGKKRESWFAEVVGNSRIHSEQIWTKQGGGLNRNNNGQRRVQARGGSEKKKKKIRKKILRAGYFFSFEAASQLVARHQAYLPTYGGERASLGAKLVLCGYEHSKASSSGEVGVDSREECRALIALPTKAEESVEWIMNHGITGSLWKKNTVLLQPRSWREKRSRWYKRLQGTPLFTAKDFPESTYEGND